MKLLIVAIVGLGLSCLTPVLAAQSQDDTPPDASLNVEPAGIAVQDWQIGTAAIQAAPSPIGPALPGFVYVEVGARGAEARLTLDQTIQQYSYDCPQGRCVGFAPDVWRALPSDQQRAYVDSVLDALMQSYPNLGIYRVFIDPVGVATWDAAHGRTYRFQPPF